MKQFAVIGDPVEHSLSPELHAWCFEAMNLQAFTEKVLCKPIELEKTVNLLKDGTWSGMNVTIPHKVNVIKYVDVLDPFAKKLGSVNCLAIENGKIIGRNTDGPAFSKTLEKHGIQVSGKKCLILGSGGVAKTVIQVLAQKKAGKIQVWSRKQVNAENFIKQYAFPSTDLSICSQNDLDKRAQDFEILINCTPLGMGKLKQRSPVASKNLHNRQTLIDCIYKPLKTRFLLDGEAVGAKICSGMDMFIYQALYTMHVWYPDMDWSALSKEKIRLHIEKYL